jgi:teichoic acid transport system permease protein
MSTTGVPVEVPSLRDAYETARLGAYLRQLWWRREYVSFVALSELRSRQMATLLGNFWHLLNPVLSIAVYYIIFGTLLKVDRGVDNYILFLTIGVLVFSDVQRATTAGAGSIAGNRGLLQSLSFPRAMLPLTAAITESLATAPSLLVIYAVAVISGETARWTWMLLPVVLGVQFMMNVGLAMLAARAGDRLADLKQILPFVFRLLLYSSGVIFSVESYAGGRWAWVFEANPVYCYLSIARWTIMGGSVEGIWFTSALSWSAALAVGGLIWFRAAEHSYGHE